MEASKFLPEGDPQPPNVVVLVEKVPDAEPIYHFFVDGQSLSDVGATREYPDDNGLVTYNFFNEYKQFAAADLIVKNGMMFLEWFGPEGDHRPPAYMDLLPHLVDAAVYADYGVSPFDEAYPLH
jgi:hypothetical protein